MVTGFPPLAANRRHPPELSRGPEFKSRRPDCEKDLLGRVWCYRPSFRGTK
jgi:hypothetical protein